MSPHCHPQKKILSHATLKKACELTSKSKRTIQRYMANGKLSYKTNDSGHKEIDTSELMRVFSDL
jgi:predicted site-specific integrase-resolvase